MTNPPEAQASFSELLLPPPEAPSLTPELAALQTELALHPLTMEDLFHKNHLAKFEFFDEYLFLVIHYPHPHQRSATEIHLIITSSRLVLVVTDLPQNSPSWQAFFFGEEIPLHVRDMLAIIFRKFSRALEDRLNELALDSTILERRILESRTTPQEILALKHAVREYGVRTATARDALTEAGDHIQFLGENRHLFRRTMNRLHRLLTRHDLLTTQLTALFDVYWGQVGTETNEQLKRLTIIATLFLPIAVWSGFFGMNFAKLPFAEGWFLALGLTLMGGSLMGVLSYLWYVGLIFRKKNGLRPSHRHTPRWGNTERS